MTNDRILSAATVATYRTSLPEPQLSSLADLCDSHETLRAENARLRGEVERVARFGESAQDCLRAENARLREALRDYGYHRDTCPLQQSGYGECTCGFDTAQRKKANKVQEGIESDFRDITELVDQALDRDTNQR